MQAQKLHLPLHHRRRSFSSSLAASSSSTDPSSLVVSSLLLEPSSRSLALMLSDSSALLYPPFPLPLPPASFPPPTPVPPVSTSACFLRLQPRPRVLFLSAASQGASVLLRAWILSSGGQRFAPARLSYKRDRPKPGIILDLPHGFSVTLAASVNVFVLHSPAAARIWVCAARLVGEAGEGDQEPAVEVMKCAAIECTSPIFSIHVSPGFLLLGELSGVRVFPLRTLVKGRAGGGKDSWRRRHEDRKQGLSGEPLGWGGRKLPNGLVADVLAGNSVTSHRSSARSESSGCLCDSKGSRSVEGKGNDVCDAACVGKTGTERSSAKLRTVKLRPNSGDLSSYFVAIGSPIRTLPSLPVKAISIHGLSHKRFLILDSTGDLHLLSLYNPILASEATLATSESSKDACMMQLDYTMKVQMLAVLPDLSMRRQIIWISDAFHSVHIIQLADDVETNKDNAMQAIFVSERIQDIVPLAANTVMILGQGDIFVYSIA